MFVILVCVMDEDGNLLEEEWVIVEIIGLLVGGYEISVVIVVWFMIWLLKKLDIVYWMWVEVKELLEKEVGFDLVKVVELFFFIVCFNEL